MIKQVIFNGDFVFFSRALNYILTSSFPRMFHRHGMTISTSNKSYIFLVFLMKRITFDYPFFIFRCWMETLTQNGINLSSLKQCLKKYFPYLMTLSQMSLASYFGVGQFDILQKKGQRINSSDPLAHVKFKLPTNC